MEKNKKKHDARLFLEKLSELDELVNTLYEKSTEPDKSQNEQNVKASASDKQDLKWLEKCFW